MRGREVSFAQALSRLQPVCESLSAGLDYEADASSEVVAMFDPKKLDEVVRRLGEGLPEALTDVRSDFEKTLRLGVQQVLASMEVVTREDFEVQRLVLERSRERLEALEKRVAALEAECAPSALDTGA